MESSSLPVILITGSKGNGKTALMETIIQNSGSRKLACITNPPNVTNLRYSNCQRVELSEGCICCSLRHEVLSALTQLILRRDGADYLLIEVPSYADPASIIQTILNHKLEGRVRLDAVIMIVDAPNHFNDCNDQEMSYLKHIAAADLIILTNSTRISRQELTKVKQDLLTINPYAKILERVDLVNSLELVFGVSAHNPSLSTLEKFVFRTSRPLSLRAMQKWVSNIPVNILRGYGVLNLNEISTKHRFFLVGSRTEIESSGPWQQPPYSEFVFFGQKLDHVALRHQLERCVISQVSPWSRWIG